MEFVFDDVFWLDFMKDYLLVVIVEYNWRDCWFGGCLGEVEGYLEVMLFILVNGING